MGHESQLLLSCKHEQHCLYDPSVSKFTLQYKISVIKCKRKFPMAIHQNKKQENYQMTIEERELFDHIRNYAEEALKDFDPDPQKTPIAFQLKKLRPIMQQIAMEKQLPVEDIFIKYMDLASEDAVEREKAFQERMDEDTSFSGRANRAE